MTISQMTGDLAQGAALETVKFQVFSDDSNLDSYDGTGPVWTRASTYTHQNWNITKVGETPEGTFIYTVESKEFPKNYLTVKGMNKPVRLEKSLGPEALSQRWVVDRAKEHTPIMSYKFLNGRLRGQGLDKPVILIQAAHDEMEIPWEETWTVLKSKS